ncbi:hypothetical protein [uncultured Thiodictyon sp.]|jgi:hypothetical protein|uniref:hypothetical protein n=1 Tax=uncultured Thiodictyon sp. TaxID=1846217 RepID=UPI0025E90226|nr:hypothetical protein [uncultured Thiodictyon sp.]
MKWSTTIMSALFLTAAAPLPAGTFDNAGVAVAGSAPVVRILNCDLMKTSFKGSNAGWLSSADKSVESSCLAGDTALNFSATADNWPKLLQLAGQPVIVRLAQNKGVIKEAKTDWVLVDITAKSAAKANPTKICGDDKAPKEFKDVWSHGYRVGVPVDVWQGGTRAKDAHWTGAQSGHKDDWYADLRLSRSRNAQWAPDGSVRLGAACAAAHAAIATAAKPLIFVYDQGSEDPEYVVVETYAID